MIEEIKVQWIADLRSGEFPQAKHYLGSEAGFCCLGVLCEQAVKAGVVRKYTSLDGHPRYGVYNDMASLPPEVMQWAGLTDNNPEIRADGGFAIADEDGDEIKVFSLAERNDNGATFAQIADLIEQYL